MPTTKNLIEVALPLAACRDVLFASLVDDPSSHPEQFPTEDAQQRERERLFGIIERLVKWENSNNEHVLTEARTEILKSTDGNPPPVYDPFAGGGSIPLEAQRLGLETHASDLNPVAVLINKALIEIPPKFANKPPINPEDRSGISADWRGCAGLAADIRYYGRWMRDEAQKRIGSFYPKVKLPRENGGGEALAIAWLWVRTVKCPNPACGAEMPLTSKWSLSTRKGGQTRIEPVVDPVNRSIRFHVKTDGNKPAIGTVGRRGARCIVCANPVSLDYVRDEARNDRMDIRLLAIAVEGQNKRFYVPPSDEQETIAKSAT